MHCCIRSTLPHTLPHTLPRTFLHTFLRAFRHPGTSPTSTARSPPTPDLDLSDLGGDEFSESPRPSRRLGGGGAKRRVGSEDDDVMRSAASECHPERRSETEAGHITVLTTDAVVRPRRASSVRSASLCLSVLSQQVTHHRPPSRHSGSAAMGILRILRTLSSLPLSASAPLLPSSPSRSHHHLIIPLPPSLPPDTPVHSPPPASPKPKKIRHVTRPRSLPNAEGASQEEAINTQPSPLGIPHPSHPARPNHAAGRDEARHPRPRCRIGRAG